MRSKIALLLCCTIMLSACGKIAKPILQTPITIQGTVIENTSHLPEQPSFLLVNEENSTLLAYITSNTIGLNNFIDETGTITGTIEKSTADGVPEIMVTGFSQPQAKSLEELLINTIRREATKAPFYKPWNSKTTMLVLQSDDTGGGAQVQVNNNNQIFIVKLVKNQQAWHIADIESKGYSTPDTSPLTGSGSHTVH